MWCFLVLLKYIENHIHFVFLFFYFNGFTLFENNLLFLKSKNRMYYISGKKIKVMKNSYKMKLS